MEYGAVGDALKFMSTWWTTTELLAGTFHVLILNPAHFVKKSTDEIRAALRLETAKEASVSITVALSLVIIKVQKGQKSYRKSQASCL